MERGAELLEALIFFISKPVSPRLVGIAASNTRNGEQAVFQQPTELMYISSKTPRPGKWMRPQRIKSFSSRSTAAIYNAFSGFTTVRLLPPTIAFFINNTAAGFLLVAFIRLRANRWSLTSNYDCWISSNFIVIIFHDVRSVGGSFLQNTSKISFLILK